MVPIEEREEFFEINFKELAKRYRISHDRSAQHIEIQRFAYLCEVLAIKMYDHQIGPDAYTWFYNWGYQKKIKCSKLEDEVYDKNGKFLHGPWPTSCKTFFEHLSFAKYTDILERLLFPIHEPLLKREPMIWMPT